MGRPRCLVAVHAHPDDESSKAAATVAKYASLGVRAVLVCCTDGAAGQVKPDLSRSDLATTRAGELHRAAATLGYEATIRLGFADSGTDGAEHGGFATVALDDVVDVLAFVFRTEEPDVVITYDPAYAAGHPDHLRAHDATVAAFHRTAAAGGPPRKLYGTRTHSPGKLAAMHAWLTANRRTSPYTAALARTERDDPTTTRVHVGDHLATAAAALREHRSQVAPDEPWFFSVPPGVLAEIYPWDDFVALHSDIPIERGPAGFETDLFARLDGFR